MAIEVDATPNGAASNSFVTLEDYSTYWTLRAPLDLPVTTTGDIAARNVIWATRVLSTMVQPRRTLKWGKDGKPYYYISRTWTGAVATDTQSLAWGRTGMYDELGRAIASNVIPQRLKDATSELAGQLGNSDRTLDNEIAVQGITSIKAGSIALTFKEAIEAQVLPDAVTMLLVPSWLTDERIEYGPGKTFIFQAV